MMAVNPVEPPNIPTPENELVEIAFPGVRFYPERASPFGSVR